MPASGLCLEPLRECLDAPLMTWVNGIAKTPRRGRHRPRPKGRPMLGVHGGRLMAWAWVWPNGLRRKYLTMHFDWLNSGAASKQRWQLACRKNAGPGFPSVSEIPVSAFERQRKGIAASPLKLQAVPASPTREAVEPAQQALGGLRLAHACKGLEQSQWCPRWSVDQSQPRHKYRPTPARYLEKRLG